MLRIRFTILFKYYLKIGVVEAVPTPYIKDLNYNKPGTEGSLVEKTKKNDVSATIDNNYVFSISKKGNINNI